MKYNKKSGFAVVELLLVLILLAIVGFTGYYVWNSKNTTSKALAVANDTAQSTSPKSTAPSQKYLTISEWGVKLPLTSDISDAYYLYNADVKAVYLSKVSYKGTDCSADNVSLGAVARFTSTDKDNDGHTFLSDFPTAVKVGQYYYNYEHPQSACDGQKGNSNANFDPAAASKASELMAKFKTASDGIVAAQ